MSKYGDFSGPYFPVFGLNTKIYGVNLLIQSEYRKIRTRKNSVFGHFSRSGNISKKNFCQFVNDTVGKGKTEKQRLLPSFCVTRKRNKFSLKFEIISVRVNSLSNYAQ